MKHARLSFATPLAVALAVGLVMGSPAWAVLLTKAADWRMNERSGKMIDSSRHHNNGTPKRVVRTGSTYRFNGSTSRVVVPDHASLDPASNNIKLMASVRVSGRSLDDDSYDVVRKGLFTTPGGYYKMEIIRRSGRPTVGKLHCLFKGRGGTTVSKVAEPDIVDGRWHTLACKKTRTSVVARVDGGRSYTTPRSVGSISNASHVVLGAKQGKPRPDDMFDGSMNRVRIHIGRR